MIIAPELQALRSNDAPQRQTQRQIHELVSAWRAGTAFANVEDQFLRYAEGETLTVLSDLHEVFTPNRSSGTDLAHSLVQPLLAFLRGQPLGEMPMRHHADDHSATLVLCQASGAVLALQLVDGSALARRPAPLSAVFTPGETHEIVLAGTAETDLVSLVREQPGRAELAVRSEAIRQGDVLNRNGSRECQILRSVEGAVVSLKLQRRPQIGSLTRQFALSDGRFLGQAAGSPRETRLELAAALLGRMGRSDAAPLLAAMAQEEAGQSLRWQSLKECLGLDTATGFSALCAVAEDADDPLASPAGALRAQLLETYPVLQRIAACRV